MSEQIKAGDLVVIVKTTPCGCCPPTSVGRIFRVIRVKGSGLSRCTSCGFGWKRDGAYAFAEEGNGADVWRLKRIPPLRELDDVKREEEIHA